MPRFEPFAALRYSTTESTDITALTSAPYDVFDEDKRADYAATDPHNIVLLDYPIDTDGGFARILGARFAMVLSGVMTAEEGGEADILAADLSAVAEILLKE